MCEQLQNLEYVKIIKNHPHIINSFRLNELFQDLEYVKTVEGIHHKYNNKPDVYFISNPRIYFDNFESFQKIQLIIGGSYVETVYNLSPMETLPILHCEKEKECVKKQFDVFNKYMCTDINNMILNKYIGCKGIINFNICTKNNYSILSGD